MSYPESLMRGASYASVMREQQREREKSERDGRKQALAFHRTRLAALGKNRVQSDSRLDEIESQATTIAVGLASARNPTMLGQLRELEIEMLAERRIAASYDLAESEIRAKLAELEPLVAADEDELAREAAEKRRSDLLHFVSWAATERHQFLERMPLAERKRFINDLAAPTRARWLASATIDEHRDLELPMPWENKS